MRPLDRISVDPNVRFGRPCVRGTRISVGDILGYLAGGVSDTELLADFPQLTQDDIRSCLSYAAEREHRTISILPTLENRSVEENHRLWTEEAERRA